MRVEVRGEGMEGRERFNDGEDEGKCLNSRINTTTPLHNTLSYTFI